MLGWVESFASSDSSKTEFYFWLQNHLMGGKPCKPEMFFTHFHDKVQEDFMVNTQPTDDWATLISQIVDKSFLANNLPLAFFIYSKHDCCLYIYLPANGLISYLPTGKGLDLMTFWGCFQLWELLEGLSDWELSKIMTFVFTACRRQGASLAHCWINNILKWMLKAAFPISSSARSG